MLLKSGQRPQGQILLQDDKVVVLDTGVGVPITYYQDEIKDIVADEDGGINLKQQADTIQQQAAVWANDRSWDDAASLLHQAIRLDPTPLRQMNYASVLFAKGVFQFKKSDTVQGTATLHESEEALNTALSGFHLPQDAIYAGQCYFLLAEMYSHVFGDTEKAKKYYQQSQAALAQGQ